MNNIIKSIIVIIVCILLIILVAAIVVTTIKRAKQHKTAYWRLTFCAPLIALVFFLIPYTYPAERIVDLKLHYVVERKDCKYIDSLEWYGIFGAYGLGIDSRFNQNTIPDVTWCELDLENHSYNHINIGTYIMPE